MDIMDTDLNTCVINSSGLIVSAIHRSRFKSHELNVIKTLVTGAAGFIGSHVCLRLLERGGDVIGL